jgi:N-acetylgalactosamine-6-sulfatase
MESLRRLLLLVVAAAFLMPVPGLQASEKKTRPNIVFLYCDDLGYGSIGINGAKRIFTPNIDKLAAQGVNCTQMYAGSATCSPSRASVITGRFPWRVGIPFAILKKDGRYLPARPDYLPAVLKTGGYHTAHIGKWHLGGINRPEEFAARKQGKKIADGPLEHGFDTCTVMMEQQAFRILSTNGGGIYVNGTRYLYQDNDRVPPYNGHWTTAKGDYSVEYIKSRKESDQPFFLNLWFDVPHLPIEEPPALIMKQYLGMKFSDDPEENLKLQYYCGMISHMDEQVGRIVAALKECGMYDNTLIAFSSDNGGALNKVKIAELNLPFSGGKLSLANGGIRMPSFFVWNGRIPAGEERKQAIHQVDLLPTFCDAAGIPLPAVTDQLNYNGISVLDYLCSNKPLPNRDLYFTSGKRKHAMVRNGRWKLAKYFGKNDPTGTYKLFDMDHDIKEKSDLSGEMQELFQNMKKALETYISDTEANQLPLSIPVYPKNSPLWESAEQWKEAANVEAENK